MDMFQLGLITVLLQFIVLYSYPFARLNGVPNNFRAAVQCTAMSFCFYNCSVLLLLNL